jgi:hypothetical protein
MCNFESISPAVRGKESFVGPDRPEWQDETNSMEVLCITLSQAEEPSFLWHYGMHPERDRSPSDLEHKQAFETMFIIPVDDQHGITSVVYKTAGNRSISNLLEMEPDGSEGPVV